MAVITSIAQGLTAAQNVVDAVKESEPNAGVIILVLDKPIPVEGFNRFCNKVRRIAGDF